MDKFTFLSRLQDIVSDCNEQLTQLVQEAQSDLPDGWNTTEPLPYCGDFDIDDEISRLIQHGAWVHDRIRGLNRLSKRGSLTKKIRKVLGYTYP